MSLASQARYVDVLPTPDSYCSRPSDRISHQSRSDWPRSSNTRARQESSRVDSQNLRQLDLQEKQELGYKHCYDRPIVEETTNSTQRWLESLDTSPTTDMNASLYTQSARRHEFEALDRATEQQHVYPTVSTNHPRTAWPLTDRSGNSYAQMPVRSSVPHTSSSSSCDIAEFLRIPLASSLTRELQPGFATTARNDLPTDFAAQMTCLFWFESTSTLQKAENYTTGQPLPVNPANIAKEATPSEAFAKWAANMLSITQVSKSVTLLALLFIYRLKTLCPKVKGKFGSEYRLLTVALMLGNKFLDDNTYTNKTWAEVSHISVAEIHMMEVEFLSNMRYSLLATEDQWLNWQVKLSRFSSFVDTYKQVQAQSPERFCLPPPSNIHLPSPNSSQASPPRPKFIQNSSQTHNQNNWPSVPNFQPVVVPNLMPIPELHTSIESRRKRSYDIDVVEPPAKRLQSDYPGINRYTPQLPAPIQANLGMPTPAASVQSGHFQSLPSLPVGLTTPAYTPHTNGAVTPTVQLTNNVFTGSQYGTPARRSSPHAYDALSYDPARSYNSSPISGILPHSYAMHSPSMYLQHRSSPYRPVRPPHTLLHPPPSEALQNHLSGHNQMHYQPLGRRHDYRSGVLPDYNQNQYMSQQQTWQPHLPQPNFTRRQLM